MLLLCAAAFAASAQPASAAPALGASTWSDEFDGSALDPTKWTHRAPGPRHDGILTADAVSVGGGLLTIKTYTQAGKHYSGMIASQNPNLTGFEQRYGYFEARIKFNSSPGMWSAFWLQSPSIGNPIGDPATAGVEMDVAEHRARCVSAPAPTPPSTCSATSDINNRIQQPLVWDGYGSDSKAQARLSDPLSGSGNGSWHTWALQWTPDALTFFYDDAAIWSSTGPISQRSEYIILSSEVGAFFAGAIPRGGYGTKSTTKTNMQVDYVRVYALA
jgi:beta-glucanase (GH16 family)